MSMQTALFLTAPVIVISYKSLQYFQKVRDSEALKDESFSLVEQARKLNLQGALSSPGERDEIFKRLRQLQPRLDTTPSCKGIGKVTALYIQLLQPVEISTSLIKLDPWLEEYVTDLENICNIPRKVTLANPYFLEVSKTNQWNLLIKLFEKGHTTNKTGTPQPFQALSGQIYTFVQDRYHENTFHQLPWNFSTLFEESTTNVIPLKLNKENVIQNYRLTYRGFVNGNKEDFLKFTPLLGLSSQKINYKCSLQFITCCPKENALPGYFRYQGLSHSFLQMLIPDVKDQETTHLFTLGYWPKENYFPQLIPNVLRWIPGGYRSDDNSVTRIVCKQQFPFVREYELSDDNEKSYSWASLWLSDQFEFSDYDNLVDAFLRKDFDNLRTLLASMKGEKFPKENNTTGTTYATRQNKAAFIFQFIKDVQEKKPSFNVIENNCTIANECLEMLVKALLDANYNEDNICKVYGTEIECSSVKPSLKERVKDTWSRSFIYFCAASPIGYFTGRGCSIKGARVLNECSWDTYLIRAFNSLIFDDPNKRFPKASVIKGS
jgi:hypothetical protein